MIDLYDYLTGMPYREMSEIEMIGKHSNTTRGNCRPEAVDSFSTAYNTNDSQVAMTTKYTTSEHE